MESGPKVTLPFRQKFYNDIEAWPVRCPHSGENIDFQVGPDRDSMV